MQKDSAEQLAHVIDTAQKFETPYPERITQIRALFAPHLDTLPSLYVERFEDDRERYYTNVQVMTLVLAELLEERSAKLDEMVLECVKWLRHPDLVGLLRGVLPGMNGLQEALIDAAPRWRDNHVLALLDLAESTDAIVDPVLGSVWKSGGGFSSNGLGARDSLFAVPGEFFCEKALARWSEEAPGNKAGAKLILDVLAHQKYEGAAEIVVLALGNKIKATREHACKVMKDLGEPARPVLEANVKARKKAVRECCIDALAALDSALAAPVQSEEELAEQARKAQVIEDVLKGSRKDRDQFVKLVEDEGVMAWMEAMALLYGDRRRTVSVMREILFEQRGKSPRADLWRVYVGALADYSPSLKSYEKKHDMRVIADAMDAALLDEVFVPVLTGQVRTFGPELFAYYFKRTETPRIDVIVAGLSHGSKATRDAAFDYAQRIFASADSEQLTGWLEALEALVDSKQKHTRELAAKIFSTMSAEHLSPHVEVLQKRKDKERSADVLDALDAALATAGVVEAEAGKEDEAQGVSSWEQAQGLLESQRARKVPSFIDLEALPELVWRETKEPLSEKAMKGLLTTLRQEGPDSRDEVARQVRPWLDDASAHAFSIALKDQWLKKSTNASHKWATYQQGIFVHEDRLDEFAPHLANWISAGRHHWAKWYMDILARHGSEKGRSWVVHWALNAEHRSLHEHANALVDELATQQGVTRADLCARANLYIVQDAYERDFPTQIFDIPTTATLDDGEAIEFVLDGRDELVIERASGKRQKSLPKTASAGVKAQFKMLKDRARRFNANAISYLEECMISARPWTKATFEAFFLKNPVISRLADRLLFLREDGELFHIDEGDIIDVEWEPMTLPEEGTIRIAHVHDIKDRNVDKWLAHMGEGDVVQPFAQLDRAFFTFGEEPEIGEVSLATLAGRLSAQGWRHGRAEDAGMIYDASKIWPGRGVRVTLGHNGIYAGNPGMYKESSPVRIEAFRDLAGESIAPKEVDPIAYSETWLALQELTR